jgi:putative membrane protein
MKVFSSRRAVVAVCCILITDIHGFNTRPTGGAWKHHVATAKEFQNEMPTILKKLNNNNMDDDSLNRSFADIATKTSPPLFFPAAVAAVSILFTALPAEAASVSDGSVIPSALAAYGHYVTLLIAMGLLVYERISLEAGIILSKEKEKSIIIADAAYLLTCALVVATGSARATDYGKGMDFYIHEPYFWLKMAFVSVQAGLGAFPAITYIKRAGGVFGDQDVEPMSEKLTIRLQKVFNAEISGLIFIPLAATLMTRGVSYSPDFPWQAGAALTSVALLGSSAFYAKQALTWSDDDKVLQSEKI